MKVEVAVLGSPSLIISRMVCVDVKHRFLDSLAFKLGDLSASKQESVDFYMEFIYLSSNQLLVALLLFRMRTIQVSSVQFKMVSMRSAKPICALPRL